MRPKNTTTPSPAQQQKPDLYVLRLQFRAAHGAYGIARVLLEDQEHMGEMLAPLDREALMSALEYCAHTLYSYHEEAYQNALPHAAEQGGAQ